VDRDWKKVLCVVAHMTCTWCPRIYLKKWTDILRSRLESLPYVRPVINGIKPYFSKPRGRQGSAAQRLPA
jgi:hypothetical protein